MYVSKLAYLYIWYIHMYNMYKFVDKSLSRVNIYNIYRQTLKILNKYHEYSLLEHMSR